MNSLSIEQAAQNIDSLISSSRMTRQEHIVMQQSLELLRSKASAPDAKTEIEAAAKEGITGGDGD